MQSRFLEWLLIITWFFFLFYHARVGITLYIVLEYYFLSWFINTFTRSLSDLIIFYILRCSLLWRILCIFFIILLEWLRSLFIFRQTCMWSNLFWLACSTLAPNRRFNLYILYKQGVIKRLIKKQKESLRGAGFMNN